jgi:arabinan endo-1,5-alpha-L-arabinosidase
VSRRRTVAVAVVAVMAAAAVAALAVARPWEPRPRALELAGDLRVHDPALVAGADGEPWFVYSTGDVHVGAGAPQVRRSDDGGRTWVEAGTAWDAGSDPEWVRKSIDGVENFWAPELYEHDGTWYLYYSASTFGSNRSAIGLRTGATPDPDDPAYGWTDQGMVVESAPGRDNFNAIDPGIVEDADGKPWLFFGSFWGGLQVLPLEWPSGKPADGAEPVTVASRVGVPDNPIEAPYVVERDGWYYLFFSRDLCCRGVESTYNIAVGRSREVTGPYVDAQGKDLVLGGGTPVLGTEGSMIGPGGQSVSRGYLAFHYYDGASDGEFRLAIQELAWSADGWPLAVAVH